MGIEVINARDDIRAMRVNNLSALKSETIDKLNKELNDKAYPNAKKKVHSFDDIETLFRGV